MRARGARPHAATAKRQSALSSKRRGGVISRIIDELGGLIAVSASTRRAHARHILGVSTMPSGSRCDSELAQTGGDRAE